MYVCNSQIVLCFVPVALTVMMSTIPLTAFFVIAAPIGLAIDVAVTITAVSRGDTATFW
jgi:hypothetical protein